jgi:hypothetical protein
MLYNIFHIPFIVKTRFEQLTYSRVKEEEELFETHIKQNRGLFKFTNKIYFKKLILPRSNISNITDYTELMRTNNIFKFLNSYRFKRLENILIAAVKFRNLQILADLLSLKLIGQ